MYLKRLEMIGFKSFPEKIKLEFNKGITAVVGPNGSGKSNISDAVRWVLGEQSAKSLRGAKMEDVIFAGTANRKPLGYAEVSMVIDNTDKGLNIEYSEVTISRRVFRSGEGEYLLNGTTCRLRDIHELFMDTGIGKEGYSIIGQGKIEEVLSSKGEERRHFFEEAAGIVKFKSRRYEALNKLEKERENLVRISDIIEEIEGNLEPLRVQSEKAKEYLLLANQLKLVQMNIFMGEVEGAQVNSDKINENIALLNSQIDNENKIKQNIDKSINEYKNQISQIEDFLSELNNQLIECRSEFEQTENDITLKQEQKNHIVSNIQDLKNRIMENQQELSCDEEEIRKNENLFADFSQKLLTKKNILSEKEAEFKGFEEIATDEQMREKQINASIIESMQSINEIGNSIARLESVYEQYEMRMEEILSAKGDIEKSIYQNENYKKQIDNALFEYEKNKTKYTKNIEILNHEKENMSVELTQKKGILNNAMKSLDEANYKIRMLSELESGFEGYQKSVKSLLTYSKNGAELKGVIGAVGELVDVDKEYETAIEIALGAAIQNIVTETDDDAKKSIDYLKKNNLGRATFLPISTIKERKFTFPASLLKEKGVFGLGNSLVQYDKAYEIIFNNLLGNILIVDDIDTALHLAKKYNQAYRIVTLSGEQISPGGAITGGSMNQRSVGIFSRKRELNQLNSNIISLEKTKADADKKVLSIKKQLDVIDAQREENQKLLQEIEISKSADMQKVKQIEETLSSEKNNFDNLENEYSNLMNLIDDQNKSIRELEIKKGNVEKYIEEIQSELKALTEKNANNKSERDIKAEEITEIKLQIVSLEEQCNGFEEKIDSLKEDIENRQNIIAKFQKEIGLREESFIQKESEIEELFVKTQKLKNYQIDKNKEVNYQNDKKIGLEAELEIMEKENFERFESLSRLSNQLAKLELQKEHIDENLAKIYDSMWEEYEVTYNQAKEFDRMDLPLSKLSTEERRLKASIKSLGNINVGAVEEYKLVSERYEFMNKQAEDIKIAEEKLKQIISQLTELMEKQFKEHFETISSNFSIVFKEIFGGGTAYLKLTDEENVLESPIEIVAKPQGKALQSLSLLSGGERALTATALLFAILRMKPSPFCILDEIESALDDVNVKRYVDYLRNFYDDTQFILITHKKSVMEAADVLYGITMQEQGVSALVSVKLEDAGD